MDAANQDSFGRQTLRMSRQALLQRAAEEPDLTWRVLATLNAFRVLIAVALLALFFAGDESRIFGDRYPTLFLVTAGSYCAFAVLAAITLHLRWVAAGFYRGTVNRSRIRRQRFVRCWSTGSMFASS